MATLEQFRQLTSERYQELLKEKKKFEEMRDRKAVKECEDLIQTHVLIFSKLNKEIKRTEEKGIVDYSTDD
jgi:phage pi2 protein 07